MITRRRFLETGAVLTEVVLAGVAYAQGRSPLLIGWLSIFSQAADAREYAAFKEGMAALGWKEGVNYILESRWADGKTERLPALAEEIVARKPAIIVAALARATEAATKAAPGIPVVQVNGGSPVALKLAHSLARPGGMVTGVINIAFDVSEKYLELLRDAVPVLKRVGFLIDATPGTTGNDRIYVSQASRVGKRLSVDARIAEITKSEEIESAVGQLAKSGAQGLVVMPSGLLLAERDRIVKFATVHRLPVVSGSPRWTDAGALISYGVDTLALARRAAWYVDRILKGAKPGELPIEQPTVFEMVVNLRTAKTLGLTISPAFLVRVNRVIE